MKRVLAIAIMFLGLHGACFAHGFSSSYVSLVDQAYSMELRWDIAVADLETTVSLDADGDGLIRWSEIETAQSRIASYAFSRLSLAHGNSPCKIGAEILLLEKHADVPFVSLSAPVKCVGKGPVFIDYRLLFDLDPSHRGMLRVTTLDGHQISLILSPEHTRWQETRAALSVVGQAQLFLLQGVVHIWSGYDHLAFLLLLLLPTVVIGSQRQPFRSALIETAKVVTAFTIAHSVTLSLAVLNIVQLPARPIEAAIAGSVVIAGLASLIPRFRRHGWWLAFGFGLVHGFGFANALSELGVEGGRKFVPLFAFNVGVEAGQLVVVLAVLPILFVLARRSLYVRWVIPATSAAIAITACYWLFQRLAP